MQIPFSNRMTSAQWEPLPIPRMPGLMLWVWYRPLHLPFGLTVSVPFEVQAAYPAGFPFTLADVLLATGVDPGMVHSVAFHGAAWQTPAVFAPFLNHGIPPMLPGAKPEIAVQVNPLMIPALAAMVPIPVVGDYSDGPPPEPMRAIESEPVSQKMMYDRIENSWRISIQMERQMSGLRQKLASVMAEIGKLDRELAPDERLAADREDRDAWQEARRWMRDLGAKCHREIKNFDVGMTSAAGKRNAIQQVYDEVIVPRAPSEELTNIRREFESYRRDMMNLQKSMQVALQAAGQNGTQRAHRVLSVIGKKIRERRARLREPIGGTNMDKTVRRKS